LHYRSCVGPTRADRRPKDERPCAGATCGTTGAAGGVRRSGCPGDHASAPQGLISDRKASDLAPSLSSATGSANYGLHVIVKQARDRQFEYLNAQQEALVEDEKGDEYWSNPKGGGMTRLNYWICCQRVAARKPKQ
jgi:hypothetical protein